MIATEKGWNLYVCGNGGSKPRHAELLAADIDEATLIRYIDRFLIYYIQTADRLTRTARWLEALPGGVDYLRKVVVDDHLGVAAELEAQAQQLVDSYECEWKQVVESPELQQRFRHFANADAPDETLRFVEERGQRRPADWTQPPAAAPLDHDAIAEGASWVPLASVDEVPADGGVAVRYGDVQLALFHVAAHDAWYATQNRCPHTGDMVLGRGIVGDQRGRPKVAYYNGLDHAAAAGIFEIGYQLPGLFAKPWLRLGVNVASGDGDPGDGDHDTFFNMLPTNHQYYGFADQLSFQNLTNPFVQIRLAPHPMLAFNFFVHWFELTNSDDMRYSGTGAFDKNAFGFPASPSTGRNFIGIEYDLVATITPHRTTTLEVGYSHLDGGAMFQANPSRDVDFLYLSLELRY